MGVRDVADLTGFSVGAVRAWRRTWLPGAPVEERRGPEPHVNGGRLQYRTADVAAWDEAVRATGAVVTRSRGRRPALDAPQRVVSVRLTTEEAAFVRARAAAGVRGGASGVIRSLVQAEMRRADH